MEEELDNPKPFQKKSSISWVSPFNPWWLCLPISWASKGFMMQYFFLLLKE
jgi:hypothetical protein